MKCSDELLVAYNRFASRRLATPDKRGKFPMAAMKEVNGQLYPVPLTHAMTEETFEAMRQFMDLFGKEMNI